MLFLASYFENMDQASGIQVVILIIIAFLIWFMYSKVKRAVELLFSLEQQNKFAAMQRKEIMDALKKLNMKE